MPIIGQWQNPAIRRCYGKGSFPNVGLAEKIAQRDSERTGELIVAYKSYDCGRWHVGHGDQAQILVREQIERRGYSLPTDCPHCGGPIPEQRCAAAWQSGNRKVYCSDKCKQKGGKKARHARRAARLAEFESLHRSRSALPSERK